MAKIPHPRHDRPLAIGGGALRVDAHDGQSAARVSGACFAMGEAAGTAAALALDGNAAAGHIDIGQLQARLKREGAFIGRDQRVPEGI
jgi:FAD dependent oxidoreductase